VRIPLRKTFIIKVTLENTAALPFLQRDVNVSWHQHSITKDVHRCYYIHLHELTSSSSTPKYIPYHISDFSCVWLIVNLLIRIAVRIAGIRKQKPRKNHHLVGDEEQFEEIGDITLIVNIWATTHMGNDSILVALLPRIVVFGACIGCVVVEYSSFIVLLNL
ncbi:hypothetical protein ACJX0J_028929, partial [Zea mays]